MIVYRGSDVIFDHEPPKWNFWTSNTVEKNHSFARTCASIQEEGNATGLHISDYNLFLNKKKCSFMFRRGSSCFRTVNDTRC